MAIEAAPNQDQTNLEDLTKELESVFKAMQSAMTRQIGILTTVADYMRNQDELSKEDRVKEALEKQKKQQEDKIKNKEHVDKTLMDTLGDIRNYLHKSSESVGSIFTHGLAAASGFGMAAMAHTIRGGLAIAMAPFVGEYISELSAELLKEVGLEQYVSEETIDAFGHALGRGGSWAILGALFGRKYAAIFGIAGVASSALEGKISQLFDENSDGIIEAFGMNFPTEVISQAVGAGIGLALMSPKILGMITGAVSKVIGVRGLALGIAAAAIYYGDEISNFISEQTGLDAETSKLLTIPIQSTVVGATTLGQFFGPYGALVGAIAGLAVGMGISLLEWLTDREKKIKEEVFAKADKDIEAIKNGEEITPERQENLDAARTWIEVDKRSERSPEERERSEKLDSEISGIIADSIPEEPADWNSVRDKIYHTLKSNKAVADAFAAIKGADDIAGANAAIDELIKAIGPIAADPEVLKSALEDAVLNFMNYDDSSIFKNMALMKAENLEKLRKATKIELDEWLEKIDPSSIPKIPPTPPEIERSKDRISDYLDKIEKSKTDDTKSSVVINSSPVVNAPTNITHGGVGGNTYVGGGSGSDVFFGYGDHYGR